ncbi:MAG: TIGR02677 family protein [Acidimicrobiia bacterium]|nr:TIGR02677 family protein [Acidimicrobiia bacterium]
MTDAPAPEAGSPETPVADGAGRSLFRYVVGDEWRDYRAIMGVVAGTFFSEFSPDEVAARLAAAGNPLDVGTVADRLESLRRWGNLTVSASVGNPSSLADYYARRNRYLITPAGQQVHEVVEGVLAHVDEVRDVSTGRLRAMLAGLDALHRADPAKADPGALADMVGAVFDPHIGFTSEITQFFAAINQWQSRYDLTPDELRFFAEVLVGYVAERLDEIERVARPIAHRLETLEALVPTIVERASRGLADRVEQADLQRSVRVSGRAGSTIDDWTHLRQWFVSEPGRRSRIEHLTRDAIAAVRTLTLNLTRLSRVGAGAASRRADLVRLAQHFATSSPSDAPRLAVAAFGLHASNHFGVPADDSADPVSSSTSWWDAPRAPVAISIRQRGDTTNRGRPSPIPDRTDARRLIEVRRAQARSARDRVDRELLDLSTVDGSHLSPAAFIRFQELVGRTLQGLGIHSSRHEQSDGLVRCTLERAPGQATRASSPEGTLTLHDLKVDLSPPTDLAPR